MPRKRVVAKREILPDPKYGETLVSKFMNCLMSQGRKSVAEKILYKALDRIGEKTQEDSLAVLKRAIENVKPKVEVKSRRVGGSTYQVPVEVRPDRRISLALRWLIGYAQARSERTMVEQLAAEIIDAANNRGGSIKKREDTHKMADANKAFAHFRW